MMNFWRAYPNRKPKKDGFYLCTIDVGERYIEKLWYNSRFNTWSDLRRQKVFDGYVVYKPCRAPIQENRVYTDGLCDRTEDVVAWKKLPKFYRGKDKRNKTNE